jgi:hypothetical protein
MADSTPIVHIDIPRYAALSLDKKLLKAIMRGAGQEIAGATRSLIRRGQGGGRTYYKPGGGKRTASAPGQSPVSDTGELAKSVRVKAYSDGMGVKIIDNAPFALFLEAGAKGGGGPKGNRNKTTAHKRGVKRKILALSSSRVLEPRPFLSVVLDERADSIEARLKSAIMSGVKFEKRK